MAAMAIETYLLENCDHNTSQTVVYVVGHLLVHTRIVDRKLLKYLLHIKHDRKNSV